MPSVAMLPYVKTVAGCPVVGRLSSRYVYLQLCLGTQLLQVISLGLSRTLV